MRYTILLSVCVGILGPQIAAAAEGEIPKFDITAACRGSGSVQTPAKCMQDEQTAGDQLAKLWPQFKQSDASRCIQITTDRAAAASYVELLTCLQAARRGKGPHRPLRTSPGDREIGRLSLLALSGHWLTSQRCISSLTPPLQAANLSRYDELL